MRSQLSAAAAAMVAAMFIDTAACQAGCSSNNCLRGMRNEDVITAARSFCSSYTAAPSWTAPLPSFASACSATASKISSACSCIATSASSSTSSTSSTPSSSTPTSTSVSTSTTSSSLSTTSSSAACDASTSVSVSTSVSTSTVFVTQPASTITQPGTTVTETEAASTSTMYPFWIDDASPAVMNLPNPLFEFGNGSTDWCQHVRTSQCSLVRYSDSREGIGSTFSGFEGPGMLRVGSDGSEGLDKFTVDVPIVQTPNPRGEDWILSAWFRPLQGDPDRCTAIIGWMDENGVGRTTQRPIAMSGAWNAVSNILPNSAGGSALKQKAIITALCSGNGVLFVDLAIVI